MDINLWSTDKSNQMVWSSDHDKGLGHLKSYTCSFCKRGFSNAQALGGHMNIHRKDRAKLKESLDETLVSEKKSPSDHPQASTDDENLSQMKRSDQEIDSTPRRPWIFSMEDDDHDATSRGKDGIRGSRKLPFFADKPLRDHEVGDRSDDCGHVEKAMHSRDGSLQAAELDLELRLGLEPRDNSKEDGSSPLSKQKINRK